MEAVIASLMGSGFKADKGFYARESPAKHVRDYFAFIYEDAQIKGAFQSEIMDAWASSVLPLPITVHSPPPTEKLADGTYLIRPGKLVTGMYADEEAVVASV